MTRRIFFAAAALLLFGACAADNATTSGGFVERQVPSVSDGGWDSYTEGAARQAFAEGMGYPSSHPIVTCSMAWITENMTVDEVAALDAQEQQGLAFILLGECGHLA